MKRNLLLVGILAVSLAATGCSSIREMKGGSGRDTEEGNQSEVQMEEAKSARPVEVQILDKSTIREEFYSLGTVEAGRTYNMNSLVNADVEKVYVSVGDIVERGDLLFKLETDDFDTTRTSQLSGVKAQLDSARIQKESAEKSFSDTKALFDQGAVSKSSLDQAEDGLDSATISYNNALTSYNTTISSLSSSEENYIVTSPISGIVTARSVEEGQFATTQNGVTISEYNPVKITLSIPSARIDETYVGQPVHIEFPTQDLEIDSKLSMLNLSGRAGGYPAEIELDNTDSILLPGMVAEVYLETDREENVFVVKKNSVLEDETGTFVYVVKDHIASRIEVIRGLENGDLIQITGDLFVGDAVVNKGQQYIDDQDPVIVK